jgi:hypothetical protein
LIVPVRGKVGDLASIYSFNETGSLIWECLQSPASLSALISVVEREYQVSPEQAEHDVNQFLSDMLAVGLVDARPDIAAAMLSSQEQKTQMSGSR